VSAPAATVSSPQALVHRCIAFVVAFALALGGPVSFPESAHAATVAQLRAQLEALRQEAAPAGAAYESAVTTLENTRYRIRLTDARITKASRKLATSEGTLALRADALYRAGGQMGVFEFILGATSWDDLITRLDYSTLIASSDADLVKDVKETRAALQSDRVRLVKDATTETAEVASAEKRRNSMEAALAAKKNQYDRLLASIAAQSGGSYPPGPNGMIFPVRGNHYYANTWGAPRSGGRHHMGTDIMSPKGTPVVAVCSGSADPHFNALGGNSITLTGNNGWTYYYAHLDRYAVHGGHVKAGQLIGYVGNTGNAAGGPNHLHFQMGPHGNWVNPYPYLCQME
jgi:murein DD-endopeptidase MepM/ murein hydrolase activator NlpD